MTTKEIIAKSKTSAALEWKSDKEGTFAYPAYWHGKVPYKVRLLKSVYPDMPFLCKDDTVCKRQHEYYVWVNSYGAVSAILTNGEQLGLKPDEFEVTEWHEETKTL